MWKKVRNESYENFIKDSFSCPQENEAFEIRNSTNISYLIFSISTPLFLASALANPKTIIIWGNI